MKFKKLCCFGSILFLVSCNLLSLHNIKNDFRWKNKKLVSPLEISFKYNPIILREYDTIDSPFLKFHFEENLNPINIEETLTEKLSKRNFILKKDKLENALRIDTLMFRELNEMISVYSNGENEYLGDYRKYDITVEIIGTLRLNNTIKKIKSDYEFTSEPREGFIFNGMIAYTNPTTNIDKIINNIINTFSYYCYKEAKKD